MSTNLTDINLYGQAVDLVDRGIDALAAALFADRGLLTPSAVTARDRVDVELRALHVLLGVGTGKLVAATAAARGAGLDWTHIGRQLGVTYHGPAHARATGVAAFRLVLGLCPDDDANDPAVHWLCGSCGHRVHDRGPEISDARAREFGHRGYDADNRSVAGEQPCPRFAGELTGTITRITR